MRQEEVAEREQQQEQEQEDGRSGGEEGEAGRGRGQHIRAYERLQEELSPEYEALFKNLVAESDDGVRFIVGLRQVFHVQQQRVMYSPCLGVYIYRILRR